MPQHHHLLLIAVTTLAGTLCLLAPRDQDENMISERRLLSSQLDAKTIERKASLPTDTSPNAWEAKCDEVVEATFHGDPSNDTYDGTINALRRTLALDNPLCYERHYPRFEQHFAERIRSVKRHITLHIPKAGGTSLCTLVKERFPEIVFERDPKCNCWEAPHFYPVWGGGPWADPRSLLKDYHTCEAADAKLPAFVMNENYLDHHMCMKQRLYSITLRDAVKRSLSHEKHLGRFLEENLERLRTERRGRLRKSSEQNVRLLKGPRLALATNNYMTWSLSADKFELPNDGTRITTLPGDEDLDQAKKALLQFDFLLDITRNEECNAKILQLMGFEKTEFPHERTAAEDAKNKGVAEVVVSAKGAEESNRLDVQLVDFGSRLIDVDCQFFDRYSKPLDINS